MKIVDGRLVGVSYPTTHDEAVALLDAVWLVGSDPTCGWVLELPCDEQTRAVLSQVQSQCLYEYAYTGHKFAARSHLALCELVRSLRAPTQGAPIEQPQQLSLFAEV